MESFVALLRREQALLGENAVDSLQALVAEKSAAAEELLNLSEARERLLPGLGLSAGRAGMEAWLATPAGTAGQPLWKQLLALAAEARELNQINGQLIALHMQNNQQALAVLMAAANQAMTYGPDGQQRGSGSGRSLGSA